MREHAPRLVYGIVSAVEYSSGRVRVTLADEDNLPSPWLPVLQPRTRGDRAYWMPAVDEQVACLLDAVAESGVVLGALYSTADTPPDNADAAAQLAFGDGTVLRYDPATHALSLDCVGPVHVLVPDGAHVYLGGDGGKQLATIDWITERFAHHTHPTPVGMSGVPIDQGALAWPLVTDKARGE